jgi:hypothetical protein
MDGSLRAYVREGRLVMDEPTALPEGTVVNMVAVDGDDGLDDRERDRLHSALDAAFAEPEEDGIEADVLFARLRAAR